MAGLRNMCRMYGAMTVTGNDGKTINYVWDYAADEPIDKKKMPMGSERWKASEVAKLKLIHQQTGGQK